jgi:hypothetical protein
MLWLFLSVPAQADTFTLDNGTMLSGMLAEYNLRGSCQISVTEGPLIGAIVTVPCERVARFERDPSSAPRSAEVVQATPEPVLTSPAVEAVLTEAPLIAEVVAPPADPLPLSQPVDAAFAAEPHVPSPVAQPDPLASAPTAAPVAQPVKDSASEPPKDTHKDGLWAEVPTTSEAATSDAVATSEAEAVRPAIGGVILPALPNFRINRHTAEEAE